jgi:uncharacterized protein (DUF305 family)
MNNDKLLYGAIGLILGIVLTWVFAVSAVNGNNMGMMKMMGMHNSNSSNMMEEYHGDDDMSGAMDEMMSGLQNKTGDDFDKAFLAEMIVHHEGAVDMATAALSDAKHQEIKDMAKAIIDAQTREIGQMKAWQQAWYK